MSCLLFGSAVDRSYHPREVHCGASSIKDPIATIPFDLILPKKSSTATSKGGLATGQYWCTDFRTEQLLQGLIGTPSKP